MIEEDPEVIADLQLRARTERERGDKGESAIRWDAPAIVDRWPCRACKQLVDVTADTVDNLQQWNRHLAARGEARIEFYAVLFCDPCRVVYTRTAADRSSGQVDRMQPVIAQLKQSRQPETERALLDQLRAWHHPDVNGLVASIRARLDGKSAKRNTPEGA